MTVLANTRRHIKARLIAINQPDGSIKWVDPNPKPPFEIHWWVIRNKLATAFGISLTFFLGWFTAFIGGGWGLLALGLVVCTIVGLWQGGDNESGP